MDYSQFLFNKLLCHYSEWFNEQEYLGQYDRTFIEYGNFTKSKYNVDTKGEYSCMEEYIQQELLKDRKYTLGFLMDNVMVKSDVNFLTGIDISENLNDIAPNSLFTISGEHQLEFNLNK